jgi:hypothetical protein
MHIHAGNVHRLPTQNRTMLQFVSLSYCKIRFSSVKAAHIHRHVHFTQLAKPHSLALTVIYKTVTHNFNQILGTTSLPDSSDNWFEFWGQLSWLRFLVVFLRPPMWILEQSFTIVYNCFLRHSFRLILKVSYPIRPWMALVGIVQFVKYLDVDCTAGAWFPAGAEIFFFPFLSSEYRGPFPWGKQTKSEAIPYTHLVHVSRLHESTI